MERTRNRTWRWGFGWCSALLLTVAVHSQELTITGISWENDQATLSWAGGAPPFQLQTSRDLDEWEAVTDSIDGSETTIQATDSHGFFRVLSVSDGPELGEYVGQLRVAEGEFGKPMAKHRLKSLWDFYLPAGATAERTALGFFDGLIAKVEILEGQTRSHYLSPLNAFQKGSLTHTDKTIEVTWSTGAGEAKRDYTLELSFRYDVSQRRPAIHLSDPSYRLTCRYSLPHWDIDRSGEVGTTRVDEVALVEIADNANPPAWWKRHLDVAAGGIRVDARYEIGVPNLEGGPAFIFKTPLLTRWEKTVITGLTTAPIELMSRFSQTYFPGHHNFVENLYLEPGLEPGISEETLAELREMDIWMIVPTQPTAFPNAESSLRVVGFDQTIREIR